MRLKGKRIAYLVGPGFEDLEFWVPLMRLQEEGALITAVGLNAGEEYIGKQSLTACSDVGCDEVTAEEFDAVVIPGGWAPDRLRRYDGIKRLVREAYRSGKIIGMMCHAGLVGISAGIVKGHEATGSNGIRDDLVNAGAIWRDVPALRSKNLVWGRVVADLPDFCRELVNALGEEA
jgi:protease I